MQWFKFQLPTDDKYLDRNSIYHLIYGIILGLISFYWLNIWIGIILLIPLELLFHYLIGYPISRIKITFTSKNALMDLFLAFIGYLGISGIYEIFIH